MNRLNTDYNDWSHQIELDNFLLNLVSQFEYDLLPNDQIKLKLEKIHNLEDSIATLVNKKRSSAVLANDIKVNQKIFRVFIHYKYYGIGVSSSDNKAHFILWIDGVLLDNKYKYKVKFSDVFDKVRVQTDKKSTQVPQIFEWDKKNTNKTGIDGFKVKIYADKLCLTKLSLFRNMSVMERFDVSEPLRTLLPRLRPDPSLDEIVLSIWQYIQKNNLFGEKDKRIVRCDDLMVNNSNLFLNNKLYDN
jgi:hypothetical protein